MKPDNAIAANPCAVLHEISLEDAVLKLGPSWIYEIRVSPQEVIVAKNLLRKLSVQYIDNPFSPYMNLVVDDTYMGTEWSASANSKSVWNDRI